MAKCKSKVRVINGSTYVYFDEETRKDMEQIVNLSTGVFSKPFGERESKIFLDTIIDMQLAYSDDIADLEEVLSATVDVLLMLQLRLERGGLYESDNFNW